MLGRGRKPGRRSGPSVVVVGGGFAGLSALNALASAPVQVTLVDRNVYSTFQPLLYQVATAGLTSADVAYALWSVTRKTGARFHKGSLTGIDTGRKVITLDDGAELGYDYLILATGVSANFFGIPGADKHTHEPVHPARRGRAAGPAHGRAGAAQLGRERPPGWTSPSPAAAPPASSSPGRWPSCATSRCPPRSPPSTGRGCG